MRKQTVAFIVFCCLFSPVLLEADDALDSLISLASKVVEDIQASPDNFISSELLKESTAIGIFPKVLKGGYIVGGQFGKGVISYRDPESGKWSPPAFFKLYGGSFGLQAGLDQVDLILVFTEEKSFDDILSKGMNVGVNISATAGPVGREFRHENVMKLRSSGAILSYSRSKGLFAGIAFEGAKINFDYESSKEFYQDAYDVRMILKENEVEKVPETALELIRTLAKYIGNKT
ncbi:MAG: lipid-binding SYLF domain-containing protein [Candidatus Aureabacteria bacterium]|nr:lipid-binding SYLF domain-containing protein [Candidatus Auribacterota bacterium]